MKLVVGLGNPGREYKDTRHNVGFNVLDNYLGEVEYKTKKDAYYYIDQNKYGDVIFIKPLTYMNLSGLAVKYFVDFYKIEAKDILVIQDDLDLEVGTYRIKFNSSSGGHNGIKSIISELGTQEFSRLKIGIGKSSTIPADKYVLGKIPKEDKNIIDSFQIKFKEIIDNFIKE